MVLAAPSPARAVEREIIIGQSLPLTGALFSAAEAIQAGSSARIERVNAGGGIGGRRLRLVTLDDRGDPAVLKDNYKRLARAGAVVVINCVGDALCKAAAEEAEAQGLALVGLVSGSKSVRTGRHRLVVNLRPGYDAEARALARQLSTMAVQSVALIVEPVAGVEPAEAMAFALSDLKIRHSTYTLTEGSDRELMATFSRLRASDHSAVLLHLSPRTIERLGSSGLWDKMDGPLIAVSFSTPWLKDVALTVKARIFGFSNIVPNPDSGALPLVRSFQADVDELGTSVAATFAGFEAYIDAAVAVEALRLARTPSNGETLVGALRSKGTLNLGGFMLRFGDGRPSASEWVDVGVVSKDRLFLR